MTLAKPTSVTRIDKEMKDLLQQISEANGISEIDASRVLARKVKENPKGLNWSFL